jgi:hypothetical protein
MILKFLFFNLLIVFESCAYSGRRNKLEILANLAFEHGLRIAEEGACHLPKPQLVYINDSSKVYMPRATILHRCSHLYGCCTHATQTCQPKSTQVVEKYFFVVDLKYQNYLIRKQHNIQMLSLMNHTLCECKTLYQSIV